MKPIGLFAVVLVCSCSSPQKTTMELDCVDKVEFSNKDFGESFSATLTDKEAIKKFKKFIEGDIERSDFDISKGVIKYFCGQELILTVMLSPGRCQYIYKSDTIDVGH